MKSLLVTGGAGFIGSNFVHYWHERSPADRIVVLDALTYAGNRQNLVGVVDAPNVEFVHGDICDADLVQELFHRFEITTVVHFAAESHVDRSIQSAKPFVRSNVDGTNTLLECALAAWRSDFTGRRFHHISTDEVYGSLGFDDPPFLETTRYDPRSPYSASKAASDFLVRSYHHTHGLPISISNASNNYGRFQYPEKLIPLMMLNALRGKSLPVYGDGRNVRDWLLVDDHCSAIARILDDGRVGETYNVGGDQEMANIDLVKVLCSIIDEKLKLDPMLRERFSNSPAANGSSCHELITYVSDRPGHDQRYAICAEKLKSETGFQPSTNLRSGLSDTVNWYLCNEDWWQPLVAATPQHK